MPVEVIALGIYFATMIVVWSLGYHFGAKTLKDRNRKFLKMIEMDNARRSPKSDWYQGYTDGIASTLNALERFLDGFKGEKNGTS